LKTRALVTTEHRNTLHGPPPGVHDGKEQDLIQVLACPGVPQDIEKSCLISYYGHITTDIRQVNILLPCISFSVVCANLQ
jgi:hypothetical protein